MERSIAQRLLDLNRRFYRERGRDFAATREGLHEGMKKSLEILSPRGGVLDVGCGHGRIARTWKEGLLPGGITHYVGVEQSRALLALAPPEGPDLRFFQADLSRPGWSHPIRSLGFPLSAALCFSVLHHIPGRDRRLALLGGIGSLLPGGGDLALSVWQFLHVPGMAAKVKPWKEAGLREEDLEPGDVLYPWGKEGKALRYVHHFGEEELVSLVEEAGFQVERVFRSDGRTGDLGLYVLARWRGEG